MYPRRRGPGLLRTVARTTVIAGTASAVAGSVSHSQQQKYAEQQQPAVESQTTQASTASDMDAQIAEIEKLGKLKEQGLITEEEFNAKKSMILGL